jgi:uncharacterized membrane protein
MLDRITTRFLFANGFLLLCITFVPFPTAVLAAYLNRSGVSAAATFYCGTFVIINIGYNLIWLTAASPQRLFKPHIPERDLRRIHNAYLIAFPIYSCATLLAIWFPYLALALCLSLWVLWARLSYRWHEILSK